ncbi:myoglobin-like [Gigantopelta aegis]|uniref:myoglobin-like n=1 Tax=Gigantopelta aegis TaxID=1735272 RepID=UPI001B88941D|nr:myoglobin-like [Gigantopelta aegis]
MCETIKADWNNKIAKDLQGHGTAIFVNFLIANPDEQKKFTKFATVAADGLPGNSQLQAHALVVMKKLGEIINAPDINAATKDLAASHKTMNVLVPNFKKLFVVIVDYVVAKAGADRGTWTAALDAIAVAIGSQQG